MSACNCNENLCGCNIKSDFKCVIYNGCTLTPLTIINGDNLEEVVTKINSLFEEVFVGIDNAFVARNVGEGVEIYRGDNENGIEEFKTLDGKKGIEIVSEGDTINIMIDEDWIKEYYPNSRLRSSGKGVSILDKTSVSNDDYAINTLSSDLESISIIKKSEGGINIESNIEFTGKGSGVKIIEKKNNKEFEVGNLASSNDSVRFSKKPDGGLDVQVNPDVIKSTSYFKIIPSTTSVVLRQSGLFVPSSISAKVLKSSNEEIIETTEGRLAYRFDFQSGSGTTIGFNQPLVLTDAGQPKYVDFLYYPTGSNSVADIQTITIIREPKDGNAGDSPYVLDLTNDNTSVSATYEGDVVDTSTAFTKYTLYYNNEEYNDTTKPVTYTIEPLKPNGITYTNDAVNRIIQVTGLTTDSNGIFITARVENKMVASATFNVTKVRGGRPGEAGTIVYLSISNAVITVDNSNVIVPNIIYASAYSKKGTEAPVLINSGIKIRYKIVNSSSEGSLIDYTLGQPIDLGNIIISDSKYIKFYLYDTANNLLDTEDIPILRNGKDGIYPEQRYAKNGSFTLPPVIDKNAKDPSGWTIQPPLLGGTEVLWMSTSVKEVATGNLIGQWSDPVRISGPAGPKGDGADGVFIAPMGAWDDKHPYQGSTKRIEAVTYQGRWFVTRTDANQIPIGTPPTDTRYWNSSDVNYDFIATGLFLAETAWIDNLGVKNLKTSIPEYCSVSQLKTNPKRVEINSDTNSLEFYTGNESFVPCNTNPQPTIKLDAIPGFNSAGGSSNVGTLYMRGTKGDQTTTTSVSTDGIIANGGNTTFVSPSTGMDSATSIAGLTGGKQGVAGGFNNEGAYAGVAGMNNMDDMYGINFGGYFNSVYEGGKYSAVRQINGSGTNTQLNRFDNIVIAYSNGNNSITLPRMATTSEGWKTNMGFTITVINVNANTLTVNASSGNQIYVQSGNGSTAVSSASITNRGKAIFVWDGTAWHSI